MLFDNFLFETLSALRTNEATARKRIVVFMDNASIHKTPSVLVTARKLKADVILNAQYSPFLNPVEQLFCHLKRQIRQQPALLQRQAVPRALQDIIVDLNRSGQARRLWVYSMRAWQQTLETGCFRLG